MEILVQLRLEVLRKLNHLTADANLSKIEVETRRYYETHFAQDLHAAWLVFDKSCVAGAGGVTFYQVMPTYHNPSGKRACIMNICTSRLSL